MTKELQLSGDGGNNWDTLPGTSGEFSNEAESIEDTILGNTFQSMEAGLITWGMNGNAYWKGFAGYNARLLSQGTPTTMTDEAMSQTTGQSYQIDDTTRRILDRTASLTVSDNAVAVADADIESIDYLFGIVTFVSGYTVTGPVTITADYFPTSALAKAQSFTLTMNADAIDNSDLGTVQGNSGYRTYLPGLRTVSLEISGFHDATSDFSTELQNRNEFIIEIDPDGNGSSIARGFFRLTNAGQSGDVGALEEESLTFELNVPVATPDAVVPFRWDHDPATTLPAAIRTALDAWEDENVIDARYLYDGVNGDTGQVVVTDVSLSSGLDSMNEFSVELQGSGQLTAVP